MYSPSFAFSYADGSLPARPCGRTGSIGLPSDGKRGTCPGLQASLTARARSLLESAGHGRLSSCTALRPHRKHRIAIRWEKRDRPGPASKLDSPGSLSSGIRWPRTALFLHGLTAAQEASDCHPMGKEGRVRACKQAWQPGPVPLLPPSGLLRSIIILFSWNCNHLCALKAISFRFWRGLLGLGSGGGLRHGPPPGLV